MSVVLVLLKLFCCLCCVISGYAVGYDHGMSLIEQYKKKMKNSPLYDDAAYKFSVIGFIISVGIIIAGVLIWF